MHVCETVDELRAARAELRGRVALIPTMGALHAGHLAHFGAARKVCDAVAVSIFVNPTQFGPGEDFRRYPRPTDVDLAKCETAGADLVFVPQDAAVYPPGVPLVSVDVPTLTDTLEGAQRPGHFAGVCRVMLKLLNLFRPDAVTFGQKDYQQLCVVRAMVADLMLDVEIIEVPTMREDGQLAMSSRNAYLDDTARRDALGLSKALRQALRAVSDGETDPEAVEAMMRSAMTAHRVAVDYAAVRRRRTLAEVDTIVPGEAVALVAGRVGEPAVRLIDNAPLNGV
ncbi:MAG: pantoate--beta-alanine ligase [Planctomycetota bacterium]